MNNILSSLDTTHSFLSIMSMSISKNPLYDHDIKSIVSPTRGRRRHCRQVDSSSNVWKFEGIDRVRKDGWNYLRLERNQSTY
jgi:hypothetical protein